MLDALGLCGVAVTTAGVVTTRKAKSLECTVINELGLEGGEREKLGILFLDVR